MSTDTHKDWMTPLDRVALRADERSFASDNLRNLSSERLAATRQFLDREFGGEEITSDAELELEILDIIQRVKRIARAMKLPQAMEVHHQIGMAIHGSAQR